MDILKECFDEDHPEDLVCRGLGILGLKREKKEKPQELNVMSSRGVIIQNDTPIPMDGEPGDSGAPMIGPGWLDALNVRVAEQESDLARQLPYLLSLVYGLAAEGYEEEALAILQKVNEAPMGGGMLWYWAQSKLLEATIHSELGNDAEKIAALRAVHEWVTDKL